MNKKEYQKLIDNVCPKPNKIKNGIVAFLVGGLMGLGS